MNEAKWLQNLRQIIDRRRSDKIEVLGLIFVVGVYGYNCATR